MLGLVAIATMGLLAFLGAGTASATVLCTTANETEGCSMKYGAGTEIHASLRSGTRIKFWNDPKGTEPIATCSESTVRGFTANEGSATETVHGPLDATLVAGQHTGLHWGGCTHKTETITTTINGAASIGELEIHWIAGTDNGTLTSKTTDVTFEIGGVSCVYGSGEGLDLGTLVGGSEPSLSVNVTVNKVAGSFLCPSHTIWEAEYVFTEPHALYVAEK